MLQPVNLQLAPFNVEHSAQLSRDAIAAAQQTGQGQEVVQESVKRAQVVQAGIASAETQKVKRKEEDERERRREKRQQSLTGQPDAFEEESELEAAPSQRKASKSFDFYA
jgi:uncharacterized protein YfiM (DUF2279 family)